MRVYTREELRGLYQRLLADHVRRAAEGLDDGDRCRCVGCELLRDMDRGDTAAADKRPCVTCSSWRGDPSLLGAAWEEHGRNRHDEGV